ncbi:AIPR protein [Luteibacter rhizovicinus]|uniref:AIPR protein n=1 Tax=Luteibacter rhizovicinus TaxID=242606 RepID=A0A4V2W3E2_9GAMM|nr:AIPR family protein [Luteibacter rhizovicinus]TCV91619.1 AIPR protein [Luteibacter rhizovicinus]
MLEDVELYRGNLIGEIRADARGGGNYERTAFIDKACQVLEAGEEFVEYHLCYASAVWNRSPVLIDAFNISHSDGLLSIVVGDYSGADQPPSLATDETRSLVMSAFKFVEGSLHGDIAQCWDDSHPGHALAQEVHAFASEDLLKVKIYLVSDRELGTSLGKMPILAIGIRDVEIQLWDVARLCRVETSIRGREEIEINFDESFGAGIPALPAGGTGSYDSYMCIVPGVVLAGLYDRFGGRILEQNVRAFLGEGRKVNKGIRDTLRTDPAMFFAYNNGLTATVSHLDLVADTNGQKVISFVKDFQVVNGGQTTASLYWAMKANYDLSKVFVQMKLSRIPEEGFEDAVHAIARYANAQNAVSASDLFAGHPYFKRLEALSRQAVAPASAKPGEIPGYWFFERTQGSYNVELKRRKGAATKAWELLHPKKQKLTKTDVARYEVTWAALPHSVCAGAQKNVAAFARIVQEAWARNPESYEITYFRELVCKCILTKSLDADIPAQKWYPGSILRQLCSYTLALMSDRMASKNLNIDFEGIWRTQRAPDSFMLEARRLAEFTLPYLIDIPPEQLKNRLVTEWAKKEACWTRLQASDVTLSSDFESTLVDTKQSKDRGRSWRDRAHGFAQDGTWKRLHTWNLKAAGLTDGESELVERAAVAASFNFRGFRLTKLEEAWRRAIDAGFV